MDHLFSPMQKALLCQAKGPSFWVVAIQMFLSNTQMVNESKWTQQISNIYSQQKHAESRVSFYEMEFMWFQLVSSYKVIYVILSFNMQGSCSVLQL